MTALLHPSRPDPVDTPPGTAALAVLRQVFGYDAFRGPQQAIIENVAAGKDAGVARHHLRVDLHNAVVHRQARHPFDEGQINILAQRQHHGVSLQGLELAGRLRKAFVVQCHLLHRDGRLVGLLDGG